MKFRVIKTYEEADAEYKRGDLWVWVECPEEFASDPDEYYEPHWHPVTELPMWGPSEFPRYTLGVRCD